MIIKSVCYAKFNNPKMKRNLIKKDYRAKQLKSLLLQLKNVEKSINLNF